MPCMGNSLKCINIGSLYRKMKLQWNDISDQEQSRESERHLLHVLSKSLEQIPFG